MAKTNIHIETKVTNILTGAKHLGTEKTATTVRVNVYTLSAGIFFKASINGLEQPEIIEGDMGFSNSHHLKASINDIITIHAYRVPETFETARFIGTCSGVITPEGLATDRIMNVTTTEKNEVKTARKY